MPQYDYMCKKCNKEFSIFCGMNDNRDNIECEYCKSNDVYRIYSGIITKGKDFTKFIGSTSSAKSCGSCGGGSCSGCH